MKLSSRLPQRGDDFIQCFMIKNKGLIFIQKGSKKFGQGFPSPREGKYLHTTFNL